MPITKRLKSGAISETSIQKAVMQWVRVHPTLRELILHFPNEGKRTEKYGKSLKDMGMRAGVSDLFVAMQRHGYGGAWIELKSKDGILTKQQKEFLNDMAIQGYFTMVCYSIEETLAIIDRYCFGDWEEHNPVF
jgi:VRR-NUC domain